MAFDGTGVRKRLTESAQLQEEKKNASNPHNSKNDNNNGSSTCEVAKTPFLNDLFRELVPLYNLEREYKRNNSKDDICHNNHGNINNENHENHQKY